MVYCDSQLKGTVAVLVRMIMKQDVDVDELEAGA